jgi:hypothetical protein
MSQPGPDKGGVGVQRTRAPAGHNATLTGQLREIIFDPPVVYCHAVKPVPVSLPAPALLGARRLWLNIFRGTMCR